MFLFISATTKISQAQIYSNGVTTISGDNTGIGINTPTARMQIYSNVASGSTPHLKFTKDMLTSGGGGSFVTKSAEWTVDGTYFEMKFLNINSDNSQIQLLGLHRDFVKVYAPSFIVNSNFKITQDGDVGIGTLTPDAKFHMPNGQFHMNNGSIKLDYGLLNLGTGPLLSGNKLQVDGGNVKITNGKLVVGNVPSLPAGFSIYAKDGILTERVKVAVASTADWSDFVFDKNYKLLPIADLKTYIHTNKHLPSVPSANEVVSNGVDLVKMDATLLQKIEELTLYTIDLYQSNEKLKAELAILQAQINNLKK
jgi:hypothetical protein